MWIILLAWNHNKAWNTRLKKGKEQSAFGAEGINEQYSQSQFSSFYWLIHPGNFKKALCSANNFPQLKSSLRELFGSAFAGQASNGKPATRSNEQNGDKPNMANFTVQDVVFHYDIILKCFWSQSFYPSGLSIQKW